MQWASVPLESTGLPRRACRHAGAARCGALQWASVPLVSAGLPHRVAPWRGAVQWVCASGVGWSASARGTVAWGRAVCLCASGVGCPASRPSPCGRACRDGAPRQQAASASLRPAASLSCHSRGQVDIHDACAAPACGRSSSTAACCMLPRQHVCSGSWQAPRAACAEQRPGGVRERRAAPTGHGGPEILLSAAIPNHKQKNKQKQG